MEAREFFEGTTENPSLKAQLIKKWAPLVEGIKDIRIQGNTALLLENQMTHMKSILSEAMTTANVAEYTKFVFPLIRNVWPNLLSNNILSVQPLDGPIGGIAYRKARFATTKGTITAGQAFPDINNFDTTYSRADAVVSGEVLGTGDGTSKTFYKVLANKKISQGTITVTANTVVGTDDTKGGFTGTGITAGLVHYDNGQLMIQFTTAPAGGVSITVGYNYMIEATSTGISQISADVIIEPVRAVSRKLTSLFSVETTEDMKALFGADAENDLVADMASEVALEIDREHIGKILAAVPVSHQYNWDNKYDSTARNITLNDHIRTLVKTLSDASQKVYKDTLRKPANWAITSPEVISILDQLPEFVPVVENAQFDMGIQKVGTLSGKWTFYSDPYMTPGVILLGYKGPSFADAGFVFAPYVPLQLTPTFFNPADFQMTKGIRTRYASKLVNAFFFAKVTVANY